LSAVATSPNLTPSSPGSPAGGDSLPPFASLTSDIERELKAEASSPGTYHVVVNPDSFASLPEYSEEADDELEIRHHSFGGESGTASLNRRRHRRDRNGELACKETDDPNVVILKKFEESTPPMPGYWTGSSPTACSTDSKPPSEFGSPSLELAEMLHHSSLNRAVNQHGEDERLLSHFRRVVWRHLVQMEPHRDFLAPDSLSVYGADIFEREAATFRPVSLGTRNTILVQIDLF